MLTIIKIIKLIKIKNIPIYPLWFKFSQQVNIKFNITRKRNRKNTWITKKKLIPMNRQVELHAAYQKRNRHC